MIRRGANALALSLLLVGAVAIGLAAVWPAPTAGGALVPETPFTEGHRVALGFGAGTLGPLTLDIAGGADFRPLLWPANLLAGLVGPDRALVALFVFIPAFNAACGWALGAALRLGPWSRFVLGAALAWSPWVHTTLANGQLEQAVVGGAALIWAVALGVRSAAVAVPLLAVTTFAVGTAAPHVALAACVGLPFWMVGRHVVRPPAELRAAEPWAPRPSKLVSLLLVAAAAAGALAAARYHAPNFDTVIRLFAPFGSVDAAPVGAQVKRSLLATDVLRPPPEPPRLANGVVHSGYLGVPLLAAAIAGTFRARVPLVVGVVCLVLALGPGEAFPLPYALLERLSPTIAASGTPYRFLIGAVVALAASAASLRWASWEALALVALLWGDAWRGDPRALPLTATPTATDASAPALAVGSGPVLDLPVPGPRCKEGAAHYLLEATVHGRPVPVVLRPGYLAWPPVGTRPADQDFARRVDTGLANCDPAIVTAIRTAGFSTIVAHGHHDCNLAPAEVACLRRTFGPGTAAGKVVWWDLPAADTP